MSKNKFATDYILEAEFRLETARLAYNKNRYNSVVRETQIVVELSLKAFLIKWNFSVPKSHDITSDILDSKDLFSKENQNKIEKIVLISKKLRREYEISLYGDRDDNTPLSDLYSKYQAEKYIEDAEFVYNICREELKELLKD